MAKFLVVVDTESESNYHETSREVLAADKEWAKKLVQRELNKSNDEYCHSYVKEVTETSS